MRVFLIIATLFITVSTYAIEAPEFIKMKNWKIHAFNKKKVNISTTAVFYNPNKVGKVKLKHIHIDVYSGDTYIGTIDKADQKVKIKKKSSFEIPLTIDIKPDAKFRDYLTGIFSLITMQKTTLRFEGYVKVRALCIPLKVKIDETEEFSLKDVI